MIWPLTSDNVKIIFIILVSLESFSVSCFHALNVFPSIPEVEILKVKILSAFKKKPFNLLPSFLVSLTAVQYCFKN